MASDTIDQAISFQDGTPQNIIWHRRIAQAVLFSVMWTSF